MGANCCIAAKERSQPCLASAEVSAYRISHSPSWSFRWDNCTHIEDIMQNNTVFSNHSSGNIHPELTSGSITPTEGHTSGDSSLSDVFRKVKWQKSDKKMEASKLSKVDPRGKADQSTTNNSTPEANSHKSLDMVTVASDMKTSKSLPLAPPLASKAEPTDPSSSMSHSIRMDPNSMSKARQSPGHQLDRQISNGNIPSRWRFDRVLAMLCVQGRGFSVSSGADDEDRNFQFASKLRCQGIYMVDRSSEQSNPRKPFQPVKVM